MSNEISKGKTVNFSKATVTGNPMNSVTFGKGTPMEFGNYEKSRTVK